MSVMFLKEKKRKRRMRERNICEVAKVGGNDLKRGLMIRPYSKRRLVKVHGVLRGMKSTPIFHSLFQLQNQL